MPHQLTRKANHTIEISASVDAAVVAEERHRIARTFSRRARVPGFRPGKAPLQAVKARYAAEIEGELKDELTSRLWQEILSAEKDLRPLTEPSFTSLDLGDDGFSFTAEMEVRPTFELPTLDDVTLPVVSLEVAEAEIEGELGKLQEEQATWEPAGEDAVGEDKLLAEVELLDEGAEEPRATHLVIGDDNVPKEFSEALQGAAVGDERTATRTHTHGEGDDAHDHTVTTTITLKGLKRKVLPAIDDDLAQTIGVDGLDDLKQRISDHLEHGKRRQRRDTWRRHLLDHLEQGLDPAEMPASLVNQAVRSDLNRFAYSLAMQGVDLERAGIDWDKIASSSEEGARAKVLDNLVLEQLAEDMEVAVPEADVESYIVAEAAQRGIPPAEHRANLVKERRLEDLRHAARIAATIDELIRRAGGEVD